MSATIVVPTLLVFIVIAISSFFFIRIRKFNARNSSRESTAMAIIMETMGTQAKTGSVTPVTQTPAFGGVNTTSSMYAHMSAASRLAAAQVVAIEASTPELVIDPLGVSVGNLSAALRALAVIVDSVGMDHEGFSPANRAQLVVNVVNSGWAALPVSEVTLAGAAVLEVRAEGAPTPNANILLTGSDEQEL